MKRSVCIVASTLPIAFLARNADALGVDSIVTTSDSLVRSYRYLDTKVARYFDIKRAPTGLFMQSLYFGIILLKCRLFGRQLVIFHECCLPVLDLLILCMRPKGQHFPQVSMLGSVPIDIAEAPRSKLLDLFRMFGLSRHFKLFFSPPVGDNPGEYSLAVKSYPPSIKSHAVNFAGESKADWSSPAGPRAILLLTSKSHSNDEDQITIFNDIAKMAEKYGFRCDVKDHPNPYFRLGFGGGATKAIDPEMPSELLDEHYALVIGTSSTGLLSYGKRAFSIAKMLKSVSAQEIALVESHFDKSAPGHELRYMRDLQQLQTIFEGMDG